jgi:transcriptional regulator with XRE-family HTH domain
MNKEETEMKYPSELGKKLMLLRKSRNMTLEDIAKILNITNSAYQRYEKGNREPSIENLITLANIHNVSLDDLLGLNGESKQEIHSITDNLDDWMVEIIKAGDSKKEAIKNIWNEIKKL